MNNPQGLTYTELLHLAVLNVKSGDLRRALEACKEGVKLTQPDQRLVLIYASILAQLQLLDESITQYLIVIDKEPDNLLAKFQLGILYYSQQKFEDSNRTWENMGCLSELVKGLNSLAKGDKPAAKSELLKGIQENNEFPDINTDIRRVLSGIDDAGDNSNIGTNVEEAETHEYKSTETKFDDSKSILSLYTHQQ